VATIGVDFKIKMLTVDDKRIKLQIWDTAGQERFRNITQTYYKGAAGIILAYSIVDNKSYNNVVAWIKQIEANSSEDVCKILVATKTDL
jgi:small GTP-binding protein